MIVVSDASPLVSLAAVGHLGLLHELHGTIVIPRAVHDEVVIQGLGRPGAAEIRSFDWIVVRDVGDRNLAIALEGKLDRGEAEAIALAVELRADLLLIDERLGRAEAARFGLRFIGILGALLEAKTRGLIRRIEPLLDALQRDAGFRVSDALRAHVLAVAGESAEGRADVGQVV